MLSFTAVLMSLAELEIGGNKKLSAPLLWCSFFAYSMGTGCILLMRALSELVNQLVSSSLRLRRHVFVSTRRCNYSAIVVSVCRPSQFLLPAYGNA